jgi:hypothetical protein
MDAVVVVVEVRYIVQHLDMESILWKYAVCLILLLKKMFERYILFLKFKCMKRNKIIFSSFHHLVNLCELIFCKIDVWNDPMVMVIFISLLWMKLMKLWNMIENIWVKENCLKNIIFFFWKYLYYIGSRYIELYFDSPRYAALNNRRKKGDVIPRRPSHSPPKSKINRYSRSRSMFSNI